MSIVFHHSSYQILAGAAFHSYDRWHSPQGVQSSPGGCVCRLAIKRIHDGRYKALEPRRVWEVDALKAQPLSSVRGGAACRRKSASYWVADLTRGALTCDSKFSCHGMYMKTACIPETVLVNACSTHLRTTGDSTAGRCRMLQPACPQSVQNRAHCECHRQARQHFNEQQQHLWAIAVQFKPSALWLTVT